MSHMVLMFVLDTTDETDVASVSRAASLLREAAERVTRDSVPTVGWAAIDESAERVIAAAQREGFEL